MKTLILSGFGLNCEKETAFACEQAGAEAVDVRHVNDIYNGALNLDDYRFLVLIGGFMDGDDLGGAKACANRYRFRAMAGGGSFLEQLHAFVDKGRLVLGICNGFQLLVKLGLLPGRDEDNHAQKVTLTTNENARYENRWVTLLVDPESPSVYTRGLTQMELPIRHGEGRLVAESDALPGDLVDNHLVPLRYSSMEKASIKEEASSTIGAPTTTYPHNPNGSPLGIAALCNPAGTVMGLMPHPEAFNHYTNHPRWTRRPAPKDEAGEGLLIFKNAYTYLREQGEKLK